MSTRKKRFIFLLSYSTKKYKITSMYEQREIFRVYIELCKHVSRPISDQNSQMLYYKYHKKHGFRNEHEIQSWPVNYA